MISIEIHSIDIVKAPISVSAFLTESIVKETLVSKNLSNYDLVLIPGFVQWDTSILEKNFSIKIRKGPEFASDLPMILKNIERIDLSTQVPANKLLEISGEKEYNQILKENYDIAIKNLGQNTFYINKKKSNVMIGRNLPPPIIAEIVNCTEKSDKRILKKVEHYIASGADIIDIGCVSNKPNPLRIWEIIEIIREKFDVLLSIDSMDFKEIMRAVDSGIDMILSLDLGNYKEFLEIPKDIPIVILPTKVNEGYFPKDPETRVKNLFKLTKELRSNGFKKLIADPLLETPIAPGICNSLEAYFLYKKEVTSKQYRDMELPLFFGISNVVELIDIDSVGINGLLASMAIELDMGVLFTVEHSTKMMGGVEELKECIKLNYISKRNKTPPINQGIQVFRAKGKTSQKKPRIDKQQAILVNQLNQDYFPDVKGYFKIYLDYYSKKIYIQHFSNNHELLNILIGTSAEALSKKIIEINLTDNLAHINYIGRELSKAELCLLTGKPYIQDE